MFVSRHHYTVWSSSIRSQRLALGLQFGQQRAIIFLSENVDLKKARQLCMKYMLIHGCFSNGFVFAWNDDKDTCGYCRADKNERVLSLSRSIVAEGSEEDVLEIILHEIAHALDFIRHGRWRYKYVVGSNGKRKRQYLIHDKIWRDIAYEIGAKRPKSFITM